MSTARVLAADPIEAAREAGLRYVSVKTPGIRRIGTGKTFRYLDADGRAVRDAATLARIRALVLPPAWRNVWVCPVANGHIQALGIDAKGRKQYRYHHRWRETRNQTKFERMIDFARALPAIRSRVARDLKLDGLPRDKVLATIVHLLDRTGIRVGNEEYREENGSFGLTTLQDRHARVRGGKLRLDFNGKSGVRKVLDLHDPRVAKIVKHCQELPGQDLFQYLDAEGSVQDVNSTHVNDYLKAITGEDFTAKDFRTWSGTLCAAMSLCDCGECRSQREAKKNVVGAIKDAAGQLGNRPATCRKYYVHPRVLESYLCGELVKTIGDTHKKARGGLKHGLDPFERAVLRLLKQSRRAQKLRKAA